MSIIAAGIACTIAAMRIPPSSAGRAHWVALVALVALGAGIGVAVWQSRPARLPVNPPRTAPPAPGPDPGEEVIAQALRGLPPAPDSLSPADSTAYKQRWLDAVRGVDLAGLAPRQRDLFLRFANAEQCTCGCGFTLATCRESDMTCDISGPRLDALLDSVRAGKIRSARGLPGRPAGMAPHGAR
jgi:hypothetical protein